MKKNTWLLLVLVCQLSLAIGQEANSQHLSILIGPAVPVGNFASTDLYNHLSGFARTGEEIAISYSIGISDKWSFLAMLRGQRNPINTPAFNEQFSTARFYEGAYFTAGMDPPPQTEYMTYPNWKFEKSAWQTASLQVGAEGMLPMNPKPKLVPIIQFTVGAIYVSSPHLRGSGVTDTATARIDQGKKSAIGFSYSLGTGVCYSLTNRIFLTSTLSYFGTNNITFKNVKTSFYSTKGMPGSLDFSAFQSLRTTDGKQPIQTINLRIGMRFLL